MAKGIGNGFPMAAVVTTPKIAATMAKVMYTLSRKYLLSLFFEVYDYITVYTIALFEVCDYITVYTIALFEVCDYITVYTIALFWCLAEEIPGFFFFLE
jgi:hypothetical protein